MEDIQRIEERKVFIAIGTIFYIGIFMSWKQEKVSMPMTGAGILGMGSDIKISGIEMDPRNVIIATIVFVTLVKVGSKLVGQ